MEIVAFALKLLLTLTPTSAMRDLIGVVVEGGEQDNEIPSLGTPVCLQWRKRWNTLSAEKVVDSGTCLIDMLLQWSGISLAGMMGGGGGGFVIGRQRGLRLCTYTLAYTVDTN